MTLAQRVLLNSFLIIVVLIAAILAIVNSRLHGNITTEIEAGLQREARFVASQWRPGTDPDSLANSAGRALARRVTLIDSTGRVVGDSEFDGTALASLENHLFRPEVMAATREEHGIARRTSSSRGDEELYVAVRAEAGFARVSVATGIIDKLFDRARRDILTAGIVALAAAMLVAALFARRVSRPIIELRDVAQALAERDFSAQPAIKAPGEVGDLAVSLSQLSSRLESLESMRRDFVANVSHELRTPLTVVSGFAETLADDDLPQEQRREFAAMIVSNTKRMQRIVDDLLDLSRIESGGWVPKPEEIELPDSVREVLDSRDAASISGDVEIRTYIPAAAARVFADRTAVRHVLGNLVDNAIRHTRRGAITVFSEAEPGGVWIGVRDTGEGIPQEHLPRIFERFYRVDEGRSREVGGTGLGLAIVRHLTESHGGRVRATSRVGEGTSISAFFPSRRSSSRPS